MPNTFQDAGFLFSNSSLQMDANGGKVTVVYQSTIIHQGKYVVGDMEDKLSECCRAYHTILTFLLKDHEDNVKPLEPLKPSTPISIRGQSQPKALKKESGDEESNN